VSAFSFGLLAYLAIGGVIAGICWLALFSKAARKAAESNEARSSLAQADHAARSVGGVVSTLVLLVVIWPLAVAKMMASRRKP
jgi:hypothetical protein